MSTMSTAERIGSAWRLHRDGDNQGAIRLFEEIIRSGPDSVDAHYGLGLAHKALGGNEAAATAFAGALGIIEAAQSADADAAVAAEAAGDNGPNSEDRYMMLTRMLKQRLEDVGAATS